MLLVQELQAEPVACQPYARSPSLPRGGRHWPPASPSYPAGGRCGGGLLSSTSARGFPLPSREALGLADGALPPACDVLYS